MSNKKTIISIIGCGWLGLPLGQHLVKQGYEVKGSTTSQEKLSEIQAAGIQAFQIQVGQTLTGEKIDTFFQSDTLILNIPPGRGRPNVESYHPQQIRLVVEQAIRQGIKKLLFISSTGIYGNTNQVITEKDQPMPTRASGKALMAVENYLKSKTAPQLTILRLSGLVGDDRKAGRFLAGRKDIPNGNAPVNLIHRADCIQVIYRIIQQEKWGELFNLSADEHPSKAVFYEAQAKKQGFETPTFLQEHDPSFKIISNQKVKEELDYELLYPDPMRFP